MVLLLVSAARAQGPGQEAGTLGITAQLGRLSSLGIVYYPLQRVAITPFLSASPFSLAVPGSGYSTVDNSTQWSFGGGVNAQYYLGQQGNISTYVGIGGSHLLSKATYAIENGTRTANDNTTLLRGYFGAQFDIAPWLSAYANVGAGVSFQSSTFEDDPNTTSRTTEFNFYQSGLGLMLYF